MDLLPNWLKSLLAVLAVLGGVGGIVSAARSVLRWRSASRRAEGGGRDSFHRAELGGRRDHRFQYQVATTEQLELLLGKELFRLRGNGPRDEVASQSGEEPEVAAPEAHEYRVWFGTNRRPVDETDISRGFSARRGGSVYYGCCDVQVPESHRIGSVGSSALHRLLRWTDDRLRIRRITRIETERFWQSVARQLGELPYGERNAVIFIHGYNVSFEAAAIRAAQLGFDLGVGTMAFFSWPSRGRTTRRAYQSDGQTVGASEKAIADFLVEFTNRCGADAVHLIVHSMGNQGVLRAVNRIVADAERRDSCRFGQIILAAADVDADTFASLAAAYRQLAARTTLYVSQRDLALRASAWFAEYPRVGLYPPVSVFDGIDTVSVSNVDLTLIGHGYVGGARDVLQDMHRLIFSGEPPPRFGLNRRKNGDGKTYWEVGA